MQKLYKAGLKPRFALQLLIERGVKAYDVVWRKT
jgi:hypothetical protein